MSVVTDNLRERFVDNHADRQVVKEGARMIRNPCPEAPLCAPSALLPAAPTLADGSSA